MPSPLKRLRKRHEETDDWAVSFADMMTLLLCFFILMVSISAVDIEKYDDVADSLTTALDPSKKDEDAKKEQVTTQTEVRKQVMHPVQSPVVSSVMHGEKSMNRLADDLKDRLRDAGSAVTLIKRKDGIALQLHGPVFFELGKATLTAEANLFLRTIADELAPADYLISVEGHTDDLPIRTEQFPSNWELSSARAAAVARYLIDNGTVPERLDVRGYAHTRPLVPNVDDKGGPLPENRIMNRRVVILVKPAPKQDH